jgi:hypothetical protein
MTKRAVSEAMEVRFRTPERRAASARLDAFLDSIFEEAFADPSFRALLIKRIVTLEIDATLLTTLLRYYTGRRGRRMREPSAGFIRTLA